LSDRNNFVPNGSYKTKCKQMFTPTYRPQTALFVICRSYKKCGFAPIKGGLTKRQKETEDRKLRNVRIERRDSLIQAERGLETTEERHLF